MRDRTTWRYFVPMALGCVLCLPVHGQSGAPARRQLPADQRAFRSARNVVDPGRRVDALRAFLKNYPESVHADRARQTLLEVLLKSYPDRLAEIDETAHNIVKAQDKGYDRWEQQMYVADQLAEAGPSGVDLPLAAAWAQDTDRQLTQEHFDQAQAEDCRRYGTPLPAPEKLHGMYRHKRSEVLLVLAHVALKQGRLAEATAWLNESAALDSLNDELNYLRGEIALKEHRPAEALQLFERAQVLGELPASQHGDMLALYRDAHNGSEAGLDEELDSLYEMLHPQPFQPAAHTAVSGGHTALLELYTGSACGPCVGGDLALEALLSTYPRTEVVALAFDQHIPLPDPLANPSTSARAESFGVRYTPNYVLDGKVLHLYGTDRSGAERLYQRLTQSLDIQLARPSAVQLKLGEGAITQGVLTARAEVTLERESALRERTALETAEDPESAEAQENGSDTGPAVVQAGGPSAAGAATGPANALTAPLPNLALFFALVEDQVRYSGENGVRFHRMVVRAVNRVDYVTLTPGATTAAAAQFNLAEVARSNATYLERFEKSNDWFGPVEFLSRDTAMQPGHLALAAWVEDTATHHVLQSAFLPVTSPVPAAAKVTP